MDTITIEDLLYAKKVLDEAEVPPPHSLFWRGKVYTVDSWNQFTDEDGNHFTVEELIDE